VILCVSAQAHTLLLDERMLDQKKLLPIVTMFTALACSAPPTEEEGDSSPVAGANDEINQTSTGERQSCAFDPSSGKQNLFGQRAFVTMTEHDGYVAVRFEQFPSPAGAPGSALKATVAQTKDLTLHQTTFAKAKETLRAEQKLWDQLFDGENRTTFAAWEATAKCTTKAVTKSAPVKPTCAYDPTSGKPNPLGMRSYFTLTTAQGRIDAAYEQFPSNIGAGVPATIATKRTLSVFETSNVDDVRAALKDPASGLAKAVLGEMSAVIAKIDETLKCSSPTSP
jgi:hypothetical protein